MSQRGLVSLWILVASVFVGCEKPAAIPTTSATESAAPASTGGAGQGEVVVYTALDRQFSEPLLDEFTKRTGINVLAQYDTEATKTVGLVNRIRAEKDRPRCDVFWNNEILNTLRLKNEGLLRPCEPEQGQFLPETFRDPDKCWYGFAARARVLIVNTDLVKPEEMPGSIRDFADPKWRGRAGLAKPLFGTTASHVACLFALLGKDKASELLMSFKANDVQIVGGNKTCAQMVSAGALAFGFTDTDDALIEKEEGKPVAIVFPDGGADQMGTLLLPNTLSLLKDCPHPDAGKKLIDYLLSPEVEARLADGPSAQIPLNSRTTAKSRASADATLKPMAVDFARSAELFSDAAEFIEKKFLTE
jgi:iron(III) transport system substrate-binding protein